MSPLFLLALRCVLFAVAEHRTARMLAKDLIDQFDWKSKAVQDGRDQMLHGGWSIGKLLCKFGARLTSQGLEGCHPFQGFCCLQLFCVNHSMCGGTNLHDVLSNANRIIDDILLSARVLISLFWRFSYFLP